MSVVNNTRISCDDVFKADLLKDTIFDGPMEIPRILAVDSIPHKLIPFSKAPYATELDQWVHFYEQDLVFECVWHNPHRYLSVLQKFEGVISPDFSLYRDMPFAMQVWNKYRCHALGHYFQSNGIKVIPNVRFGDERSYPLCCQGVPKRSIIAVGSHGQVKVKRNREYFIGRY